MPEIEFRAWLKHNEKMIDVVSINNIRRQIYYKPNNKGVAKAFCYYNDAELMQYTGLKDKNGTKIFEGDILRKPASNKYEQDNYVAFEVFYHDNDSADNHVGFQMNRMHFQGAISGAFNYMKFLPRYTNQLEVIGNVHENPELVEPTK